MSVCGVSVRHQEASTGWHSGKAVVFQLSEHVWSVSSGDQLSMSGRCLEGMWPLSFEGLEEGCPAGDSGTAILA